MNPEATVRLATLLSSASLVLHAACGGDTTGPDDQPAVVPPARSGHAMVYAASRGVVLMFGGRGVATLGDLWSWNGTRWARLSTSGPPPRDDAVLVYDATARHTVRWALGTDAPERHVGWDGTAWTQITPQ